MIQACEVMHCVCKYYIAPWSITEYGVRLMVPEFEICNDDIDERSLGEACLRQLTKSKTIPDPDNYNIGTPQFNAYLEQLGFKKRMSFWKHVRPLTIERENGTITIQPNKQFRHRDQYDIIQEHCINCTSEAESLGRAIRDRIGYCRLFGE